MEARVGRDNQRKSINLSLPFLSALSALLSMHQNNVKRHSKSGESRS